MGFFDKAKDAAIQAAQTAATELEERKEAKLATPEGMFKETRSFGQLSVDSEHKLLKIKQATSEISTKKKSGIVGKTVKATVAMGTLGASLAVESALKPKDVVVPFDMVRGFSIIQDGEETRASLGSAVAGGLLFGGVGAAIGAAGGSGKKSVGLLALKIDLNDIDNPCAIVTYINKPTKTKSKEYAAAVSGLQNAVSCLELITGSKS